MTFDRNDLEKQKAHFTSLQSEDKSLLRLAREFVVSSDSYNYAYQWTWCGLPTLQLPQDVMVTQELIYRLKPTVVIETGVAWGGGIALYASTMDVYGGRRIFGVDLNLADSVIDAVSGVAFSTPIELLKGSSTDPSILSHIRSSLTPDDRVMVILDSDHTHEHVLNELIAYGPLVTTGQYCIVSDTIVETIPEQKHRPRSWGPGNNPLTAVWEYLKEHSDFSSDLDIDKRLLMSFNPQGYLLKS